MSIVRMLWNSAKLLLSFRFTDRSYVVIRVDRVWLGRARYDNSGHVEV